MPLFDLFICLDIVSYPLDWVRTTLSFSLLRPLNLASAVQFARLTLKLHPASDRLWVILSIWFEKLLVFELHQFHGLDTCNANMPEIKTSLKSYWLVWIYGLESWLTIMIIIKWNNDSLSWLLGIGSLGLTFKSTSPVRGWVIRICYGY